jgi:hypothetical protein
VVDVAITDIYTDSAADDCADAHGSRTTTLRAPSELRLQKVAKRCSLWIDSEWRPYLTKRDGSAVMTNLETGERGHFQVLASDLQGASSIEVSFFADGAPLDPAVALAHVRITFDSVAD